MEICIPSTGTLAEKSRNTTVKTGSFEFGYGDEVTLEQFDGAAFTIDNFHEVETEANTFVHLVCENAADTGVYDINMMWQELAERVETGAAKLQ